ncbi:MAG: hypothetical protein JXA82_18370 [Sedimentisphaerales bacterium]|nr:hypothetical protein [Sedimentisphaerales bacterium]
MKEMRSSHTEPLHLFEGYGVELEYMIVDRAEYKVQSLADQILAEAAGQIVREIECGPLAWSNELVLHVIELKTNGPVKTLDHGDRLFQEDVGRINRMLASHGCRLMPSAMHPFMVPDAETKLWPHQDGEIYRALHQVFGCQGHGWKNLQSVHLNLPFYDDEEFVRLHAAIRMVLPLIPALAAASPFVDGQTTAVLDNRLLAYQAHCDRLPLAIGPVIPEPVESIDAYQEVILQPIYRALEPLDPEGTLAYEWVNARGAIARFERNTIEIRLIDMQECPRADLVIVAAVASVVRVLTERARTDWERFNAISSPCLRAILQQTIRDGEKAVIQEKDYLECLGIPEPSIVANDLWCSLLAKGEAIPKHLQKSLNILYKQGTLATRMKKRVGSPSRENLKRLCQCLCDCLEQGQMLQP